MVMSASTVIAKCSSSNDEKLGLAATWFCTCVVGLESLTLLPLTCSTLVQLHLFAWDICPNLGYCKQGQKGFNRSVLGI